MPVQWQVATDQDFRHVIRRGTQLARPQEAHSFHVEVDGLQPGAEYFYRFRTGPEISPVGRTKTAPAPGARLDQFAFAFASCQNYPDGYYNAYANMAREDLDLVVFSVTTFTRAPLRAALDAATFPPPRSGRSPTTGSGTPSTAAIKTCRPRTPPSPG